MLQYFIPALLMTVAFLLFRQAKKEKQKGNNYAMAAFISFGIIIIGAVLLNAWLSAKISSFFGTERTSIAPSEPVNERNVIQFHRGDVSTPQIPMRIFAGSFPDVARRFGGQFSADWIMSNNNSQLLINNGTVLIMSHDSREDYLITGAALFFENNQDRAGIRDVNITLATLMAHFEPDIIHEQVPGYASGLVERDDNVEMIMATGNSYLVMKNDDITEILIFLEL